VNEHKPLNLGSTCYVNAVLQCLFAIPTFRARLYNLDQDPTDADGDGAGAYTRSR